MGNGTFTEVTNRGWGSRIGGSLKGILVGFVMIVVAFILLFWNEGRAVKRARTLNEGGGAVVSVSSSTVNSGNEGKLIHVSGTTFVDGTLSDPDFGVTSPALRLKRTVQMYQWQERSTSETKKKVGGGTETTTTYDYDTGWFDELIDSNAFKVSQGHTNPSRMPFQTQEWTADEVKLGSYSLSPSIISRINNFSSIEVGPEDESRISVREPFRADGGVYYLGTNPARPRVGDVKVSFSAVEPSDISVVAQQTRGAFTPYVTRAGGSIELVQMGIVPAEEMFQRAHAGNTMTTWLLRLLGFVLMFLGLKTVVSPLVVLADVLPIAGTIVGAGVGLVAFFAALALSFVTVAIAWLFYRPLIGVTFLVLAVAAVIVIVRSLLKSRKAIAQ